MGRLIKAEILKLSKSLGYRVLLLASLAIGIMVGIFALGAENPMDGYSLYLETILNYQVHVVLFSLYAGVFICSEFQNRTFGMSLFSGGSRQNIIFSKAVVFFIGLLPLIFFKAFIGAIIAAAKNGFGTLPFTEHLPSIINLSALCILGSVAIGSFCLFLAVLIKNIGGTIGAGIGIMLTLDLLAGLQGLNAVIPFSFIYQIGQLQTKTYNMQFIYVMIATFALSFILSVHIFKKSELK